MYQFLVCMHGVHVLFRSVCKLKFLPLHRTSVLFEKVHYLKLILSVTLSDSSAIKEGDDMI